MATSGSIVRHIAQIIEKRGFLAPIREAYASEEGWLQERDFSQMYRDTVSFLMGHYLSQDEYMQGFRAKLSVLKILEEEKNYLANWFLEKFPNDPFVFEIFEILEIKSPEKSFWKHRMEARELARWEIGGDASPLAKFFNKSLRRRELKKNNKGVNHVTFFVKEGECPNCEGKKLSKMNLGGFNYNRCDACQNTASFLSRE